MPRLRRTREDADQPGYSLTVKDMPESERPRERLLQQGPSALKDDELLAIILRTGIQGRRVTELAQDLLIQFRGLDGIRRASTTELASVEGMGPAKACQLHAALELGYRLQAEVAADRPYSITSPESVAGYLAAKLELAEQERVAVLLLDNKHRVLRLEIVATGSVNSAPVPRIAEIFKQAVRHNCPAIVLAHNHPSGDPTPSNDDLDLTSAALEAGSRLDIKLLDHIIIGRGPGAFRCLRREHPGLPWPG